MVVGSVFACFTDIVNDIPALIVAAFGFGTILVNCWNKAEKKDWVLITTLILCSIAGFCCAVAGLSQETVTKVWAAVIALVSLLIGILFPKIVSLFQKK